MVEADLSGSYNGSVAFNISNTTLDKKPALLFTLLVLIIFKPLFSQLIISALHTTVFQFYPRLKGFSRFPFSLLHRNFFAHIRQKFTYRRTGVRANAYRRYFPLRVNSFIWRWLDQEGHLFDVEGVRHTISVRRI